MEHNNIDQYTQKIVQGAGLNAPSKDFMANVLLSVSNQPKSTIIIEPLISKKSWSIIFILSTLLILAIYLTPQTSSVDSLQLFFNAIPHVDWPTFAVSKITLYSTFFLSLFIFQIPMIKYYMERRIQY